MSNDKLTVKVDGKDRELFMSYGLLQEMIKLSEGDPTGIPALSLDMDKRNAVLKQVLSERTKSGKMVKEIEDILDLDLSVEDNQRILEWVGENLLDFFVKALTNARELLSKFPMQELSSPAG